MLPSTCNQSTHISYYKLHEIYSSSEGWQNLDKHSNYKLFEESIIWIFEIYKMWLPAPEGLEEHHKDVSWGTPEATRDGTNATAESHASVGSSSQNNGSLLLQSVKVPTSSALGSMHEIGTAAAGHALHSDLKHNSMKQLWMFTFSQ